ncbi:MAG: hypothetical protein WD738_11930 [Pirellulales bacterium]
MRASFSPSGMAGQTAPACIGLGLATLIAAAWWPALPVATAYAFIALGATLATVDRFRGAAALRFLVVTHLFVYVSLYFLFVGAVCHAAISGAQNGLAFLQGFDFGVSAVVMAQVVRLSLAAVAGGGDAPAR